MHLLIHLNATRGPRELRLPARETQVPKSLSSHPSGGFLLGVSCPLSFEGCWAVTGARGPTEGTGCNERGPGSRSGLGYRRVLERFSRALEADGTGFEPAEDSRPQRFSRPPPLDSSSVISPRRRGRYDVCDREYKVCARLDEGPGFASIRGPLRRRLRTGEARHLNGRRVRLPVRLARSRS
jgi:hypothetical protein